MKPTTRSCGSATSSGRASTPTRSSGCRRRRRDVSLQEPKRAFELERAAATKLEKMGVKIVTDVDKTGFQKIADPYLDKLAKELGPHADKIKTLIRAIN